MVRQHLRPRDADLLEAVNEVIQLADEKFKEKGYQGLVIIVDNLDRIFRNRISAGTNDTTHDSLFINHSEFLCKIECHIIYTIPPALRHSPNGGKLAQLHGNPPEVMPMIPITDRSDGEYKAGMDKLVETIRIRIEQAGSTMDDAFESEQLVRRLCSASGGYVRSLMVLVQRAVLYAKSLPIKSNNIDDAIQALRDQHVDAVTSSSDWEILRRVHKTKSIDKTEEILQLLDNLSILEYRDGDGHWYNVNPLLRESRKFENEHDNKA